MSVWIFDLVEQQNKTKQILNFYSPQENNSVNKTLQYTR